MDTNRKKVIIKKYENRRLYDTTNSRYINLDEVAQLVQEGCDVEVVDAATGEDLTRLVLTQIIAEHAKGARLDFPHRRTAPNGRGLWQGDAGRRLELYEGCFRHVPECLSCDGAFVDTVRILASLDAPPRGGGR